MQEIKEELLLICRERENQGRKSDAQTIKPGGDHVAHTVAALHKRTL